MSNKPFQLTPLGGLGQIGSNMNLIEFEDQRIFLDAGILFPRDDHFGINYLIPDYKNIEGITDIVITHGHEDHIGAIHHVIKQFPQIKIWASKFSKALIQNKLNYKKISAKINEFKEGQELKFGNLSIAAVHVNHSIPETFGMLFKFNQTSLFYCSDFKVDFNSPYEKPFNFELLKTLSKDSSNKVLMVDSTNIMSKKVETPSEAHIIEKLDSIFENSKGRIISSCFSSNIHRIQTLVNLAEKHKMRVCFYGRSMEFYSSIAAEHKHLELPKILGIDEACKRDNVLILVSGCQADFKSTLRRICIGTDSYIKPVETDTFLLSSKTIPGNETKINELINKLSEQNVNIITGDLDPVHVSGHPGKDDLIKVYESFNATHIIPIHGESVFLKEHVNHIREKFSKAQALKMLNHDTLIIKDSDIKVQKKYDFKEPILIHGNDIEIERSAISKRRKLSSEGLIIVSMKLKPKVSVKIKSLGLPESIQFNERIEQFVKIELNKVKSKNIVNSEIEEKIRIAARKIAFTDLGYKPQAVVQLV